MHYINFLITLILIFTSYISEAQRSRAHERKSPYHASAQEQELVIASCPAIKEGEVATLNLLGITRGNRFEWTIKTPKGDEIIYTTTVSVLTTAPLVYDSESSLPYTASVKVYNGRSPNVIATSQVATIKVVPNIHELIAPKGFCTNTTFIVKVKDYGQTSIKLKISGIASSIPFSKAVSSPSYWSAIVPISSETSYSIQSSYGSDCFDFINDFTVKKETFLSAPISIEGATKNCSDNSSIQYSVPVQQNAYYEWAIDKAEMGNLNSNERNMVFTPTPELFGSVKILCRVSNSCGASAYTSKIVDLYSSPIINFVGLPSDICLYDSPIELKATLAGATFNGINVESGKFHSKTIGEFFPVVSYTDTISLCSVTKSQKIEVHPLPAVNAGPDKIVCQGTPIVLSGTASEALNYKWDQGIQNNHSFIPVSGTYTFTAYSEVGCTASDALTILVNPLPKPIILGLPTTMCMGENSISLFSNLQGGVFSGQDIVENKFSPSTQGLKTINYLYTDSNSCTGIDTKVINVQTKLIPPALCNGQAGWCYPKQVELCLNDAIPASIKWYDKNKKVIEGSSNGSISPYTVSDTLYHISYVSQYYCESDLTEVPLKIGVPKINSLQICNPRTVNLNMLVSPYMDPGNLLFYMSAKGGVPINKGSTYFYYVIATTTLYVTSVYVDSDETCYSARVPFVITVGGCSARHTEESYSESVSSASVFSYPLPATNILMVSGLNSETRYLAQFVNSSGDVVIASSFVTEATVQEFNIQQLSRGLYVLVVANEKEKYTLKIVKE